MLSALDLSDWSSGRAVECLLDWRMSTSIFGMCRREVLSRCRDGDPMS